MNRRDIDWSVLRGSIIVLAVTLALSAAAVVASGYYRAEQSESFEKEQRSFLSASRRYLSVDEEERLIREYLPRFERLSAAGLIGEEQRLQWLETLREAKNTLRLPSLQYSIAPRRQYEAGAGADLPRGDYEPFASEMDVTAGLVHAGDLFRLFDELERKANGIFSVHDCALNRRGREATAPDPEAANLTVSCRLMWITLRKPS